MTAAARRAVLRWAWRLFRREWRQQILLLLLVTLAVATTVVGAGVATNTPPPVAAGFGAADQLVPVRGPGLAAEVQRLRQHFGTVDVIEEQPLATGADDGASLRSQDPHGAYGSAMLALVTGRYPVAATEVAMTPALARTYGLRPGSIWHGPAGDRTVVGLVENPQNLLDVFALVPPGALTAPAQATVLLQANSQALASYSFPPGERPQTPPSNPGVDPTLIVLTAAIFGLLFVGLVAVAGFSVMAQRRLRALGLLSSVGARDRHVRLVLVANGGVVGLVAALAGGLLGIAAWLAYRPRLETVAHHRIAWNALPWWLVAAAMLLAVATTILAARRPARAAARASVVGALSERPTSPRGAHRSAIPGVVTLAAGLVMIFFSGGWGNGPKSNTGLQLGGLLATSAGLLLVTPACVGVLSVLAGRAPIVIRLALRDLARYRARSGAALAAVSFAVFLAMVVCLLAGGRFADAVDYAGPNLPANELLLHPLGSDAQPDGGPAGGPDGGAGSGRSVPADPAAARATLAAVGQALGTADVLELRATDATLLQGFRGDPGTIYLATPQLLRHYGIDPASVDTRADLLTSRSGLDGLAQLHVMAGDPDRPADLRDPVVQRLTELPTGASEPNLLLTSRGLARLGFPDRPGGWLFTTPHALTASQINAARRLAVAATTSIETRSEAPSLDQLRTWSTTAGILLALTVLAMTVGLIRSEAARDLVTLTAVGAARRTRRALTGITAGTLGLMGALLGTTVAYLLTVALFRSQLAEKVAHPPVADLAAVLIGLPVVAGAVGWLLAGREPGTIAHTPAD